MTDGRHCTQGSVARLAIAAALSMLAIASRGDSRVFVHRIALVFESGSTEMPAGAAAVLRSLVDDTRRECVEISPITIAVEEVVTLPLGKTSAGDTARTQRVAAMLRELSPPTVQLVQGSVSTESVRARRFGLKPNQVVVELTCLPAR